MRKRQRQRQKLTPAAQMCATPLIALKLAELQLLHHRAPYLCMKHCPEGMVEDYGMLTQYFCNADMPTKFFIPAQAAIDAGWDFLEKLDFDDDVDEKEFRSEHVSCHVAHQLHEWHVSCHECPVPVSSHILKGKRSPSSYSRCIVQAAMVIAANQLALQVLKEVDYVGRKVSDDDLLSVLLPKGLSPGMGIQDEEGYCLMGGWMLPRTTCDASVKKTYH